MNADGNHILFFIYAAPIAYSHGVAVLSSLLKQAGFEVSIFVGDGNLDTFKIVLNQPWRSVCFSHCIRKDFELSEPYIDAAISIGHEVLLGGTFHRRNNPNKYDGKLKICRGDGEQLVNYFLHGEAMLFEAQLLYDDLDRLPMADYQLFESYPYNGHIKGFPDKYKLPYTVSRGCIGTCNFCEVQHQPKAVRIRYTFHEDLQYLKQKYAPEMFFFTDELFPYHDDKFLELFVRKNTTPFFAFIRADIDPLSLTALIENGMLGCAFGIESGDEAYRNEILNKNLTDDQIYRTVDILKRYDTYFAHFYMIRTLGETYSQQLKTDRMAMSLGGQPMIFDYTQVAYNTRGC